MKKMYVFNHTFLQSRLLVRIRNLDGNWQNPRENQLFVVLKKRKEKKRRNVLVAIASSWGWFHASSFCSFGIPRPSRLEISRYHLHPNPPQYLHESNILLPPLLHKPALFLEENLLPNLVSKIPTFYVFQSEKQFSINVVITLSTNLTNCDF